jgi:hypothetical protein
MEIFLVRGQTIPIQASGAGFVTQNDPVVKPGKSYPLSTPDPLKPRLKKTDSASAEERLAAQRALIDDFKLARPDVSTDRMFATLTERHPDVFRDNDDEVDDQEKASDVRGRLAAKREVISHFQEAHPEMSIDEVYSALSRLNPEFFED